MAFTRSADGIAKKGKTDGKNLGNSGPTAKSTKGGKGGFGGKTDADMKSMGRGLARAKASTSK
jgi:hypothetical protein